MDSVSMTGLDLEGLIKAMLRKTEPESGQTSTGSGSDGASFAAALASNIGDAVCSSATGASSCETCDSSEKSSSSTDTLAGIDINSYASYLNDMTSALISQNDSDADGYLSAADTTKLGMSTTDFTAIDTDGDGKLSANELNEVRAKIDIPQMTSDLISSNDKSGEGQLSASDVGMSTSDFNAVDTNKDSRLSSDELNTAAYSMLTKTLDALRSSALTSTSSASLNIIA